MIATRKAHLSFGQGSFAWLDLQNDAVAAYTRKYQSETILVLNNLSVKEQTVTLASLSPTQDILTRVKLAAENGTISVKLSPYQYLWLEQIH